MRQISPLGIVIGVLATQGISSVFGFVLTIACLILYGNELMIALFEYPLIIAIGVFAGLVSTAIGGYVAVAIAKKAVINATLSGIISLALSLVFFFGAGFYFAFEHQWMLVLNLFLTIPAAYLGGHLYLAKQAPSRPLEQDPNI